MATPTLLGSGSVFAGDYEIVRPLNQGGMGAVYVVRQISTGKQRALKLMHAQLVSDPELRKRFEQEARVGSRIASEHVVEVHAAGVDAASGMPYLVMELLEGEDLAARAKRGPMPVGELRGVFEQLCHAMGAAHAVGIVHRDLKPENVFLARSLRAGGAPFTVKVLDFGIAKLAAEAGTHGTTGAMGSPLWMAPEQTDRGTVTPAADVWAMGLIAFNLLTGTHFWRTAFTPGGTVGQLLREIVLEPIPLASERAAERGVQGCLPPGFDAWFSKCMAREPHMRFFDAAQAWAALATLVGADPLGMTAVSGPSSAPMTPPVPSPVVVRAAPSSGAAISAPMPMPTPVSAPMAITGGTPPPTTSASPAVPAGRWVIATGILAGLLVAGLALAVGGFFLLRARPAEAVATGPSATSSAAPTASALTTTAPTASAAPSASAAVESQAAPTAATVASASPAAKKPTSQKAPTASDPPEEDELGPSGSMNNHVWKLKSGAHVRMVGSIVKNDSNVADAIVRRAVEWSAWQYNRCYDAQYGQQASGLPSGSVIVGFDILDQLPRHGTVDRSDFKEDAFGSCVKGTLIGQTINAAGPNGKGHVVYSFKFVPN